MGLFAGRRARKMTARLEATRAEHEAFLDSCELLCEWEVRFDLEEELVSVYGQRADGLTADEREWLDTFVAVGYIAKVLSNLGQGGRELWPDILSGEALDPEVVEEHLTFTNAPSYEGEPASEATHIYMAQVFRKEEGYIPFLQTPYEPADGNEGVLAPWSLAALVTVLRSQQDDELRPIDSAIELLETHRVAGEWDPGELSQIDLEVMVELAGAGLVAPVLLGDDEDVAEFESEGAREAEGLEAIRASIADARADEAFCRTADGEFDLRAMTIDVWEGQPTSSMQTLKQLWRPPSGRATGERWYEEELARHWDGLVKTQRETELVKLIQWRNLLDEAEHDGSDARIVGMTAAIAEKVQLLSFAIDVTHGTNYSERTYLDPLQFGVHEMRGS